MTDLVLKVDDSNFKTTVLEASGPVLVDFSATWCMPCRMQGPILERFASEREDVTVTKVDVDEAPQTAAEYGIRSVPTLAVFLDGKPVIGAAGVQSEDALGKLVTHAVDKAAA